MIPRPKHRLEALLLMKMSTRTMKILGQCRKRYLSVNRALPINILLTHRCRLGLTTSSKQSLRKLTKSTIQDSAKSIQKSSAFITKKVTFTSNWTDPKSWCGLSRLYVYLYTHIELEFTDCTVRNLGGQVMTRSH